MGHLLLVLARIDLALSRAVRCWVSKQRQTNDTNQGMRYAYPNGTFDHPCVCTRGISYRVVLLPPRSAHYAQQQRLFRG